MGTSADRSAGRGGNWTPLKVATNSYIRGLGGKDSNSRAQRVVARHAAVLGGAGKAASSGVAGTRGVRNLGALLSGFATAGVQQTLTILGLSDLVGKGRWEVVDVIVSYIAGDGDDLDAQAARDATCDIVDYVFGDADTWEEIADIGVTEGDISAILERFLALYIYNRMPVIAERLSRIDPTAQRQADQQMRDIIEDLVAITLSKSPSHVEWHGAEGKEIANNAMRSAYDAIAALDAGDEA